MTVQYSLESCSFSYIIIIINVSDCKILTDDIRFYQQNNNRNNPIND